METMTLTKWTIDKAHSEVQFKAKHLVISTVTGQFNNFDGWVELKDDKLEEATASFTAEVNSISTNNSETADNAPANNDESVSPNSLFSFTVSNGVPKCVDTIIIYASFGTMKI